jgi:RimJ/RimL family protein N-acetyltransferase
MTSLKTARLILRPPETRDAATFAALLFDYDVSKNLSSAPYPYWIGDALELISKSAAGRAAGENYTFAIARKDDSYAMGTIGVGRKNDKYSLGYWLGRAYWGKGYATEAGRAIVPFGFDAFLPERIFADHYTYNPASGRVLMKLGFLPTGEIREHHSKARGCSAPCVIHVLTRVRFETVYRSAIN